VLADAGMYANVTVHAERQVSVDRAIEKGHFPRHDAQC
jgi:hypothetical protein